MTNLWRILLFIFIGKVVEGSAFDNILDDVSSCEEICEKTYPLHTYPKPDDLHACTRGCRLYTIVEFANEDNATLTLSTCVDACNEAYYNINNNIDNDNGEISTLVACNLGCNNQQPFVEQPCPMEMQHIHELMSPDDMDMEFYHMWKQLDKIMKMFQGMFGGSGIVMEIEMPVFIVDDEDNVDMMDSFIIIESQDAMYFGPSSGRKHISATDKPKNSLTTNRLDNDAPVVMRPGEIQWEKRDREGDISFKKHNSDQFNYSSWLDCLTKKSGIPKWLLYSSLIIAVMALLWLVCGAHSNNTTSDIHTQKLSIYGDVDYLKDVKYKVMYYHPISLNDADPLPMKIALKEECSDI